MRILKIMVCIALLLSALSYKPTFAQAPIRGINQYTPRELVHHFATKYQVSETEMLATIYCESSWDPHSTGDHGKANGVAQFHKDTFQRWSKEMGEPLDYGSTFDQIKLMAWAYSHDYKSAWSCYTMIYKTHKRPLII